MRFVLAFLVLFIVSSCSMLGKGADQPARAVQFNPEVVHVLSLLAEHNEKEAPACLIGYQQDSVLNVESLFIPPINVASDSAVSFSPCPEEVTVAMWHNHPPYKNLNAWERCGMSFDDLRTALAYRVPLQVIQVDGNTLCYWTYPQVIEAAEALLSGETRLMHNRPGQFLTKERMEEMSYVLPLNP